MDSFSAEFFLWYEKTGDKTTISKRRKPKIPISAPKSKNKLWAQIGSRGFDSGSIAREKFPKPTPPKGC